MEFPIAGVTVNPLLLAGIGFLVGVLGGFFGVGGGFIAGPLMFWAGVPMNFVVGTDLAHMTGKSIVAAKRHRALGHVDVKLGLVMVIGTIPGIEGGARVAKRLFDLALAIPGLIVCLPLLPLVALVIRLDSPGRVLFKQKRVGENCQPFGMWKFRTMVEGAEDLLPGVVEETPGGQVIHKRAGDPRVTRVGRFLRRHSLDASPRRTDD